MGEAGVILLTLEEGMGGGGSEKKSDVIEL